MGYRIVYGMQEALKEIIESVLAEEIEQTTLRRISKEIVKFGGVRD